MTDLADDMMPLQIDLLDLRSKIGVFFQLINSPTEIEKADGKELLCHAL